MIKVKPFGFWIKYFLLYQIYQPTKIFNPKTLLITPHFADWLPTRSLPYSSVLQIKPAINFYFFQLKIKKAKFNALPIKIGAGRKRVGNVNLEFQRF
jgi:hypothetical protein